jgi:D-3-phosphoglycerate dehydrogenase / 2-oxoglutarate reductase
MPRVLISGPIHKSGMDLLRSRTGIEIVEMPDDSRDSFVQYLSSADALLIRTSPLPVEAVEVADRLKVVSRHGVGYDNVPVAALTRKGIALAVVGNINSEAVAEHVLFLMLSLARNAIVNDRAVRAGDWAERNKLEAFELAGRTLLLIGLGRIGRAVASLAQAFKMRVLAYDPYVSAADATALGVTKTDDWRASLADTDVLSLHVPRSAETENMIGAAELHRMKPTALLINTGRGGLVDEKALADALGAGRIRGAGIDVFEEEPPGPDHPLLASEKVILSPHIAGLTRESSARLSFAAAENVLAGLDGRLDPALVVNPEVLKRPLTV